MQDRLALAEDAWDKARPRDVFESEAFDHSSIGRLESARDSAIAFILEGNHCQAIQPRAIAAIIEAVRRALEASLHDHAERTAALSVR